MRSARPPAGIAGAPLGVTAGPSARAPAAVASRPTPSSHALALLLGIAAPLLAGGLDLGQVELVAGPLHADLLADELLDGLEEERARLVGQADRLAGRARPRGAADAVDVVLGDLGQVPVDHVADTL